MSIIGIDYLKNVINYSYFSLEKDAISFQKQKGLWKARLGGPAPPTSSTSTKCPMYLPLTAFTAPGKCRISFGHAFLGSAL